MDVREAIDRAEVNSVSCLAGIEMQLQNDNYSSEDFALRPACPGDEGFLYELYCGTRIEEISAWGWNAAQQEAFLRLQFNAQRQHYDLTYEGADHNLILLGDKPIGRILVFESEREYVLVDIALLRERRCGGIGTSVIQALLGRAKQTGRAVHLHVERNNRARRLYERLGFEIVGDTGVYFKMEWQPEF